MDRDLYREAFHLNDTELDLIARLGSSRADARDPNGAVVEKSAFKRRFGYPLDRNQQRSRKPQEARIL